MTQQPSHTIRPAWIVLAALLIIAGASVAGYRSTRSLPLPTTFTDFELSGTQIGDVFDWAIQPSTDCKHCHGDIDPQVDHNASWSGSKMAMAGRNPLFFAQMATANQDVANAGYFCMRCHVPNSFVTGNAYDPSGASLNALDRDGVNCHLCHVMVDPIYKRGVSPPQDKPILLALDSVPQHYGNAMFVLDPYGTRRSTNPDPQSPHDMLYSPFHKTGSMCGTCHDVGNVMVMRQADDTYRYRAIGTPTPNEDPWEQFPLERTYTEWKLSEYAAKGVDMGGRFGGPAHPTGVMASCQDCHMPKYEAQACFYMDPRTISRHDFAGGSVWTLQIVAEHYKDDPDVDQDALLIGQERALSMLQRAASLDVEQRGGSLFVRVVNETGHKLPTGHIEGRRVWTGVRIYDAQGALLREYGHYDLDEAHLDETSTVIYEMHVGLSEDAAKATGLSPGVTTHMALADTIEKDNRIPPRGFNNDAFSKGGAPVVGAQYADGQHWSDVFFALPDGAASAQVTVYYQMMTRHYVEALRDGNVTDDWGDILYDLWLKTDKAPPIPMTSVDGVALGGFLRGDLNQDGVVNFADLTIFLREYGSTFTSSDLNGDGIADFNDFVILLDNWGATGP